MIIKIPIGFIELKDLQPYFVKDHIEVYEKNGFLLLNIRLNQGDGDSLNGIDGEGLLSSMVNLRNDIKMGDFRVLYLAFLKAKDLEGEFYDDNDEFDATKIKGPAIPPNFKKLSPALEAFIDLFEVYEDLFEDAK